MFRKQHLYDDARKHFRDVTPKNLDWPEAVWQAWITFEQLHGSVEQLEDCLDRVNKARDQTNARRAKVSLSDPCFRTRTNCLAIIRQEAEKAAYQAMQAAAEQAANGPVEDLPVPGTATQAEHQGPSMDVETAVPQAEAHPSVGKRKAEDEGHAEGSKKARVGMCLIYVLPSALEVTTFYRIESAALETVKYSYNL